MFIALKGSVLSFILYQCVFFIMPPILKKLEGHIAFGLSVCVWGGGGVGGAGWVYVRTSVSSEWCMLGI